MVTISEGVVTVVTAGVSCVCNSLVGSNAVTESSLSEYQPVLCLCCVCVSVDDAVLRLCCVCVASVLRLCVSG